MDWGLLASTRASGRGLRRSLSALAGWRYLDTAILGLTSVAITALNLIWVSIDTRPPHWDYARHLGDSLVYRDGDAWSSLLAPLQTYVYYPPFVYWLTVPFYLVFGTDLWVAILSNAVFLAILVFATYGIGKTLWNRWVGLLSVLFVVATPMFVTMFKEYMLDAPLSAMVALALYLLIQSDHFSDRRTSLLLGFICGLGLLTKWTFPLCIWLPIAASAVAAIVAAARARALDRVVNMVGAGLIAFAVSSVWYIHNWSQIREETDRARTYAGVVTGQPPVGSLSSLLWYFWNLLNNQLYLVPFLFLAAGCVYLFRKDESASKNAPLVLQIVGTYVAFALLRNKDFRHTMPMLPAVAVVSMHWLVYVSRTWRNRLGGALVAYCALTLLVMSFGTSLLPQQLRIPVPARPYTSDLPTYVPPISRRVTGIVVFAQHGLLIGKPVREDWHVEETFREIAALGGKTFTFQYEDDTVWFNTWDVRYYALKHHLTWVGAPEAADFMVIRTKRARVPFVPAGFVVRKAFPLPDGGMLWLFGRA